MQYHRHDMHIGLIRGQESFPSEDGLLRTLILHKDAIPLMGNKLQQFDHIESVDVPHRLNMDDYETFHDELDRAAERIAKRFGKPDNVVGLYEHTVVPSARIRRTFGVKTGQGIDSAIKTRDKLVMKRAVSNLSISVPAAISVIDFLNSKVTDDWLVDHPGPYILKPVSEAGAIGVRYVSETGELFDAVKECVEEFPEKEFEIEEFISGPVYHFDALVRQGRFQFTSLSRYFGTCMDAIVKKEPIGSIVVEDSEELAVVTSYAEEIIKVMAISDSVIHLELIKHDNKWFFLEIASRVGGAYIAPQLKLDAGIDLELEHYLCQIGQPSNFHDLVQPQGISGWLLIPQQISGKVIVTNVKCPEISLTVLDSWVPQVGEELNSVNKPFPSQGSWILKGTSEKEVRDAFQMIKDQYMVEVASCEQ